MLLSVQGNEALSKMWDAFRNTYVEKNPGCNMNDVERNFLYHILNSLVELSDCMPAYSDSLAATEKLIEKIR